MRAISRPAELAAISPRYARLACVTCLLAACGGGGGDSTAPQPTTVDAVTVSPAAVSLMLDEEQALTASPTAAGRPLTGRTVTWSSSATDVATAGSDGRVRGVRAGSAVITATVDARTGSSAVEVRNPVPGISALNPATVVAGSSAPSITITGTGFASDAVVLVDGAARATSFTSRTQLLVTLNATDVAVPDTLTLTVRNATPGGGTSIAVPFTITPVPVALVTLDADTATLVAEQTRTFVAVARDARGSPLSGRSIAWSSSNTAVATVGPATGIVTAVATGTTTITASVEGRSASATVTVSAGRLIGSGGGTVNVGAVTLEFPSGAVSSNTPITLRDAATPPASPQLVPGSAVTLGPAGLTFAHPVRVTLRWNAAQEAGRTPAAFAVHRWTGTAWEALPDRLVETGGRSASGRTSGFSTFALLELPPNPEPVVATLTPATAVAGSSALTVTVRGTRFVSGSEVLVNDAAIVTTYISPDSLRAVIPATSLTQPGTITVRVRSPAPGGGLSSPLPFTVTAPSGTRIAVTSTAEGLGDATSCTVRAAMQAANTNASVGGCPAGSALWTDEIVLPVGIIRLTAQLLATDPAGVRLRGQSTFTSVLNGNSSTRLIAQPSGSTAPLYIEQMTLQSAKALDGAVLREGGAVLAYGPLHLTNVFVIANEGASGGAISMRGGGVVRDADFLSNSATTDGGAIRFLGSLLVEHSRFESNSAGEGGAIETSGGTLVVRDSRFLLNQALPVGFGQGGAVEASDATVTIERTEFVSNFAVNDGGALRLSSGTVTITSSRFVQNRSLAEDGGALRLGSSVTVTISGSTFQGNQAVGRGGAIEATGTMSLRNSTIEGSRSSTESGAIDIGGGTASLAHVTITGSTAGAGVAARLTVGTVRLANSIVASHAGGSCLGALARFASVGGNVFGEGTCGAVATDRIAANPLLGPLQDNGGLTTTRLPLTGSPAIDAGVLPECLPTDQRGETRPQGAACDAGAVELRLGASAIRRSTDR